MAIYCGATLRESVGWCNASCSAAFSYRPPPTLRRGHLNFAAARRVLPLSSQLRIRPYSGPFSSMRLRALLRAVKACVCPECQCAAAIGGVPGMIQVDQHSLPSQRVPRPSRFTTLIRFALLDRYQLRNAVGRQQDQICGVLDENTVKILTVKVIQESQGGTLILISVPRPRLAGSVPRILR
jgi:hypothetical protein